MASIMGFVFISLSVWIPSISPVPTIPTYIPSPTTLSTNDLTIFVASEIDKKYVLLGAEGSFLGAPIGPERNTSDEYGRFRNYEGGSIYWRSETGAYSVQGRIRDKWASLGWERSVLGYPITDETITPDGIGRFNHFQGGSIYWTLETGAYSIQGQIHDKWASLGWERSILGYPITDETITPDGVGRFNHFQKGSIYWSIGTGAHEVHGLIRDKWAEMGWEQSWLGYPIGDEEPSSGEWIIQSRFEHGVIKWSPDKGATAFTY